MASFQNAHMKIIIIINKQQQQIVGLVDRENTMLDTKDAIMENDARTELNSIE